QKAREGEGPSLIEAITYRLSDHTTADDASRYRDDAEVSEQWKREPVRRLKTYLQAHANWSNDNEETLRSEIAALVDAAAEAYLQTPPPTAESMFDNLFADLPPALEEQRASSVTKAVRHD
ncbi:MAG: pyruvate dehydrogenase (acetyl-transferring) E1 component subunit alpha, partial [Rhizobiales bacterium]|nr:pyruvate dehydrogenase (acetyl-transferring) E1 component subunit alpha [Hyphomicrobiales bacterium]